MPLDDPERPNTTQNGPRACEVTLVAHHVGVVGGMERILAELALGLTRRGHEVTVIAHARDHRSPMRACESSWAARAGSAMVSLWDRAVAVHDQLYARERPIRRP
ncbi:MAG: glycosyltransferase family 4 protein [Actinobacteria bacterium]|nr:MAG: glycosyltransferase family 4 protein [Actinomycetota bacterium]